ncbi:type III pantothenate kinase [Kordiimonas laminariae]|uniref:type III pantothenate kinase n=1 Tax=Kordiimonas laminariae TaxID=2917717 RepID=UPI001FF26531|nr:type III pantothenate kinase [Kordiimonas laminariae]MCK0071001.1 type III pantothenate kinase [Kordiimonas laminariae]
MLLTIDVGNTNTVFALLEDEKTVEFWRLSTVDQRTVEEYMVWISHLMALHDRSPKDVHGAIIASVVPQVVRPLKQLCEKYFDTSPLVVGDPGVDIGVEVDVTNPGEVGADRLVNAVAANDMYGGPLVVVDFGTATTFDVVGETGAYLGGLICPGINLSLSALHQAAAKLPRIAVTAPEDDRCTGKTTLEAMQYGIFWGYIGMIEGIVKRLKKEHSEDMKVLATGGLAPVFADWTNAIDEVSSDLTLEGLRIIFDNNNK